MANFQTRLNVTATYTFDCFKS